MAKQSKDRLRQAASFSPCLCENSLATENPDLAAFFHSLSSLRSFYCAWWRSSRIFRQRLKSVRRFGLMLMRPSQFFGRNEKKILIRLSFIDRLLWNGLWLSAWRLNQCRRIFELLVRNLGLDWDDLHLKLGSVEVLFCLLILVFCCGLINSFSELFSFPSIPTV